MTIKSDDEIMDQVLHRINSISSLKLEDFEILVNAGLVTIIGRACSYKALSEIENQVSKIAGVHGLYTYVHADIDTPLVHRQEGKDRRCVATDRRREKI